MSLIAVHDLTIGFDREDGSFAPAVRNVELELAQGEFVGLVGESGSGKSTLGYGLTRLLKPPGRIVSGSIVFDGVDIAHLKPEQVRTQRRGGFAMIPQAGMNALNPVRTIRSHFVDVFRAHSGSPSKEYSRRATALLADVELTAEVLDRYPGELSGGMRQRAAIAIALALEPRFMVFDEPTTALDVLVQDAVMATIDELQRRESFTALLISHDLGLVLEHASRVLVMHDGVIEEDAPSREILTAAQHPYTKMLMSHFADPRAEHVELPGFGSGRHEPPKTEPSRRAVEALVVRGVSKLYRPSRRDDEPVSALRDVSFTLEPGASIALVGASGSGKSTLARLVTGVERPSAGTITMGQTRVDEVSGRGRRRLHKDMQLVFQDPYSALNPVHRVGYAIGRSIQNLSGLRAGAARAKAIESLEAVGLIPGEEFIDRRPHELSGGQRQRVVIARALACEPQVLVADEPVSMLDISLRAGILALLDTLRRTRGVSLLYITHDLLSARVLTEQIIVLRSGMVVETGPTAQVMRQPEHEYTRALLDAVPDPWSRLEPALTEEV